MEQSICKKITDQDKQNTGCFYEIQSNQEDECLQGQQQKKQVRIFMKSVREEPTYEQYCGLEDPRKMTTESYRYQDIGRDDEILKMAFYMFNTHDYGSIEVTNLTGYRTNISVGHLVCIDTKVYRVKPIGWELLPFNI